MRKIRFLLFALLALLYVTNVRALTKGNQFTRDGITYQVTSMIASGSTSDEVAVVSSTLSGTLTIPSTVKDLNNQYTFNVTSIASAGSYTNVNAVVLPSTLKTINTNAFSNSQITTINIPAGTDNIMDGAFAQIENLTAITVDAGNSKYTAEDGVLYEDKSGNKYLKAYPVAKAGTTFTVPSGVYGVSTNGFQLAKNLTTINLPASIQDLPTSAEANGFTSAKKLTAIKVDPANTNFKDEDGVVLTQDGKTLVAYPFARHGVVDPAYNGPLVTMHPGEVYTIPASVETISKGAFAQVSEITAVKLNNVKKISAGAFYSVRNLRNVELGASVETIEDGAITGSPDFTRFAVDSNNPNYTADAEGIIYTKNKEELVLYPSGRAGEYSTLPTTKKIRKRAFYYAQKVTKVNFNSALEDIDNDAFQVTTALNEITFAAPSSLKRIGTWVFYMSGLTKLELPASLKEIGSNAFKDNKNLKTVTVADNSQLESIDTYAFTGNSNLESFTFEGSTALKTIRGNAFSNDTKLASFDVPANVETINRAAFDGTSSMKHVTFQAPAKIKTIGEAAFQNANALENIDLPEGLLEIKKDAFNKCTSLTEIGIPSTVTTIDPTGFQQAEKLERFDVNKNNTVYSSVDGFLLSKDKKTLVSFPPAKAGTYYTLLPPTIETIGAQAFYAINKLENITIPEKVNRIERFAFDNLVNLKTIAFLGKHPIAEANIDPSAFNPDNVHPNTIDLSVRKGTESEYAANNVWKKFHQLGVSFFEETNGAGNGLTEYFPLSQYAVMIVGTKADVFTYVVKPEVKNHLDGKTYEVRLWGDYALNNNTTNIEEVVFKNTLDYVGIDAFKKQDGSSTVKRIYFTATVPTKDMSATKWEYINNSGTYTEKEFEPSLKIYVKKSAENAYKTATGWARYAVQTSYKIPGEVTIQNLWGTFAREFDADLGIYNRETGKGKVAAFVAQKSADVKVADPVHTFGIYKFKVESIDMHGGVSGDESYVPADNGVLIEARQGRTLPADFYYAIGEKDNTTYTIDHNMMTGVTVKKAVVNSTTADPLYAMSKSEGLLKLIKPGTSFNFPVHKAYARPQDAFSGAAKAQPVFDEEDNNDVTGIENIENTTTTDNNVYYNLQGQRVENPQHGVFIHNGKKVVLK
ncbi:leucine rich repeat protein [Prevotella sp. oral taxon 306 str. F0472]|uniref:leucine-rich repeat domain-containing protein n=1 Tax=Prevotella sp. oral taxon 306 TaxID=712461 RepID=UPI00025BA1C6|nr:leucine-rich repeat domain-containing protein [Prevotella sp. oral taxon 306]EID32825.1 leucine rich repeat protein [Prevotella sp. oral taxon 306 str. F0472]MBF1637954.1 leucine-rich repeat protein [Prevotella sp.]